MRRKEQEILDLERIAGILEQCHVMRLGMVKDQVPYVVPVNFGYEREGDQVTLYFHGASQGRKIQFLTASPRICFEMDHMRGIEPHELPCSWTCRYESVIGYGTASHLETHEEQKRAMDAIMKRSGFDGTPEYPEKVFEHMLLWKVEVQEIVGKSNCM